ncbi:hypothetical protein G7K71_18610 [Desulfofundulus sp. TPOSR]|uniref:hypothetical protein n=1 Tax=Desulfofundulus sp. TPOSR TaxID=2714340 RepID=UPI00140A847F|nr:hypothetical protein [Desulfofundulus sp. TPOSR]NHM28937.1 hypothetical protein [Desulfofundulus sp. TPOSR]
MTSRYVGLIFGAGASAAEGAPVIKNFLQKAFEFFPPDFGRDTIDDLTNDIWNFLIEYYNKPLRTSQEVAENIPALDEVFTNIDYAISNNLSLTPFYNPERLSIVKKSLISLICKTLTKTISSSNSYQTLLNGVLRSRTISPIFISLNYDCILDKCLSDCNKLNYGFISPRTFPILIKLHGSLNWSYCSLCERIDIHNEDDYPFDTRYELKCSLCGNSFTQPVLITPTLFKNYDIPPLKQLWSLSLNLLSTVDKVVFIGYSLPENDVAVIQLIKRAFAIKGKMPEIMVVDKNNDVFRRYIKIFGGQIAGIDYGFSPECARFILDWLKQKPK